MDLQLRNEIRGFTAGNHEVGICEKLLLLSHQYDHRQTRLVARINEGAQNYRWTESSISSIGSLASGDLLMTFCSSDAASSKSVGLDLQAVTEIICQPDLRNHRRLIFGTRDGGESLFICQGIDVAGWSNSTAYMTFVPTHFVGNPLQPRPAH